MKTLQFLSIIAIILLAACSETKPKDERPTITVSILPQKYFTERITGNNFKVNVLVPFGSSPETFEPTPRQMQDLSNSLLYFRVGYIEFETTILTNIQKQNIDLQFVNTAEGMDLIAADIVDHGDHVHLHGVDPHTWLTIPGIKVQIKNMLDAIINIDPENKDYYLDNYNKFNEELDQLHNELSEKFSNVRKRTFIVFHPAMAYFARDYGLTQISIEQEGKNPTAANMRKIIDISRQAGIRDVFIQMEFERDNALAIARELDGGVIEINPLSEDWMENMKKMADLLLDVLNKE